MIVFSGTEHPFRYMTQVTREQLKVAAEQAILVAVQLPEDEVAAEESLGELRALAQTAGASVVGELVQRRGKPVGRTYLGAGKVEELKNLVEMTRATLVIFDNDLTPAQIRVLEQTCCCKIIDRSELILDIFANRAATHAAKLQVEIAQLEYTYPRLRAMWNHLGQIVGGAPVGIGTRGPGEKQLEIDRRIVQRRLRQLRRELESVQQRKTREVARRKDDHYTVGLVGYTNAGKSTLFNRLTEPGGGGGAFAHDKLFATLSTRIEQWNLGGGNNVLLSDTVGFIRNLPHHLVASFRSTLEETVHADLVILVLDASDPEARSRLRVVEQALDDIGADQQPRLLALNKMDRLEDRREQFVWLNEFPDAIPISAATGEGLDDLAGRALEAFLGPVKEVTVTAPLRDARVIDYLEKRAEVLGRAYLNGSVRMTVRIGARQVDQLLAHGAGLEVNGCTEVEAIRAIWRDDPGDGGPGRGDPPHLRHQAELADSDKKTSAWQSVADRQRWNVSADQRDSSSETRADADR